MLLHYACFGGGEEERSDREEWDYDTMCYTSHANAQLASGKSLTFTSALCLSASVRIKVSGSLLGFACCDGYVLSGSDWWR